LNKAECLGANGLTASPIAAMCSGVVPQQPLTNTRFFYAVFNAAVTKKARPRYAAPTWFGVPDQNCWLALGA